MSSPLQKKQKNDEDPAVSRFRQYLRINTVQPDPDYTEAVKFLQGQATEIGLECNVIEVATNRPVVVLTWSGKDASLPSLMLNSHIDVVPVYPDEWSSPPFEAVKKENGDIIARGSQDMKSVGMQYLEGIRCLKAIGKQPLRTIHVTFVPDEEIGGTLGMELFVKTDFFKRMNVGFGLDESVTSDTDPFLVFKGERNVLWFKIICHGNPGHGSRLLENTAAEKLQKVINAALEYREKQKKRLEDDPSLDLGDITSVNMNIIEGGVQPNVIPSVLSATFDMRITPTDSKDKLKEMIMGWVEEAGPDCTVEWVQDNDVAPVTDTNPATNPWWRVFESVLKDMNLSMNLVISSVGTDARFLRQLGIPALGFSPINNTPVLLHDHNEFLNETTYIKGIDIYTKMIEKLMNMPRPQ